MPQILVVDDDVQVREMLTERLAGVGYSVSSANDGVQCLAECRKERPQVIIMDLIMPEKEGMETIGIVRNEFPEVMIIAISGGLRGGTIDFLPIAKCLGAEYVFRKPVNFKELREAINTLLIRSGESRKSPGRPQLK